jgi:hypothetical protein
MHQGGRDEERLGELGFHHLGGSTSCQADECL